MNKLLRCNILTLKISVIAVAMLATYGVLHPIKAHAISNNNFWIPGFITNDQEANNTSTCDRPVPPTPSDPDPQYNYAQFRWISPAGAYKTTSTTPSLDVTYGQSSVNLAVNYLSSICNANINGPYNSTYPYFHGGIQVKDKKITRFTNVAGTASSSMNGVSFGTLSGIDGEYTDVLYADGYANNWRYMTNADSTPFHNDFTLGGIGGLSVGLHTIVVNVEVRVVHKWIDDKFVCVDYQTPGDTGDATSLNDPKCLKSPTTMTIVLNVLPPADVSPSGSVTSVCEGLKITGAEDPNVPDQSVHFDVYHQNDPPGTPPFAVGDADASSNNYIQNGGVLSLIGQTPNQEFKVGFYNYTWQGVNDNSKAHWVEHVLWNPASDPACPNFLITDNPGPITLDNEERPTTASFTNTFTAKNPLTGSAVLVKGVDVTCQYEIRRFAGGSAPGWPKKSNDPSGGDNRNANINGSWSCNDANVNLPNWGTPIELKPGDQICAVYTVNPNSGSIDATGTLTPAAPRTVLTHVPDVCVTLKNRPVVSFYGSDVFAGGSYANPVSNPDCTATTSTSKIVGVDIPGGATGLYRSGVEFAALAIGTISNSFNSGRVKAGSALDTSLAFANTSSPAGGFIAPVAPATNPTRCLYDYYQHQNDGGAAPSDFTTTATLQSANGKYKYPTTSLTTLPLDLTTMSITGQKVLYVEGDVKITGNITYNDNGGLGWASPDQIPSFYLVVKGNIYIDPSVTRLDGVYIAEPNDPTTSPGYIYTCYNSGDPSHRFAMDTRFDSCGGKTGVSGPLKVNGAFQAYHVFLDRTSGSLRDAVSSTEQSNVSSKAGEVFTYGPEMYMATPALPETSAGSSKIDSIQVLPPVL